MDVRGGHDLGKRWRSYGFARPVCHAFIIYQAFEAGAMVIKSPDIATEFVDTLSGGTKDNNIDKYKCNFELKISGVKRHAFSVLLNL